VQVTADGVPPVAVPEHLAQSVCLAQPRGGAEHVADRDRAAEHRGGILTHGVVAEGDEVVVPGEDLLPVGLRIVDRVVVQGGDCGLELVAATTLQRQCRLQDADTLGDLSVVPSLPPLEELRAQGARITRSTTRMTSDVAEPPLGMGFGDRCGDSEGDSGVSEAGDA